MADEISKTTIVVLLILTILISVIGTWTVVTSLSAVPSPQTAPAQDNSARISLTVEPQPEPAVPITGNAVLSLEVMP
jgi:hypothetical protein